jgi:thiamine-phosphate pyrophosphorylase
MLFFTDPARSPDPAAIIRRLPPGAAVVFRAFGAPDAVARGRALARLAHEHGVAFWVGADAGLAGRVGADGLHLPERAARRAGDIRKFKARYVVTAAAHSRRAALRAARAGVNAIVVSPVFPSRSPSAGRPLGPRGFATLIRGTGVPAYALGGVDMQTARGLVHTGARGFAAIEAFVGANSEART